MISPRVARSIKEAEAPELAPKAEDKPDTKAAKSKPKADPWPVLPSQTDDTTE